MARSLKKRSFRKSKSRKIRNARRTRKTQRRTRRRQKAGEGYDFRKMGVALPGLAQPKKDTSVCVKTVWNEDGEFYYENADKGEFYKEEQECINNI